MRFKPIYDAELRSNQRDALGNRPDKLAEHKQAIRKVFHRQLKHLWETRKFLSSHKVYPKDFAMDRAVSDNSARWGASRA